MSDFDYPKVKSSLGQATLRYPCPVWSLDPRGVIHAANLLAYWLWKAIQPEETIRSDALLGKCVFDILAANLERIPLNLNEEFYAKKSAVVKRMDAGLGSPLYAPFIAALKADPSLKQIYDHATPNPDREWEYSLKITAPDVRESIAFLEFLVNIYRMEGDDGLIVIYTPTLYTLPIIEEQYSLLLKRYGDKEYEQSDHLKQYNLVSRELLATPDVTINLFAAYYPTLIQDALWYITEENNANQLLLGESVVGKHFFELFFSSKLRQWLRPLHETSAPRAIKYFETFTERFQNEDHVLHTKYEQVMKRLLRMKDFRRQLEISRKLSIHLNLPKNAEDAFYTCRVLLPWPVSHEITLQFRSMVRFIHKGLPDQMELQHYQVTLVPENYETEAALILLHLVHENSVTEDMDDKPVKQLLWGLAIMKTIVEGLMREDTDIQWEPVSAFRRIRNELSTKFRKRTKETINYELRVVIESIDKKGILDKGVLLTMLKYFTTIKVYLSWLNKFFTKELEIYKRVEEGIKETKISFKEKRLEDRDNGFDSSKKGVHDHDNELKTLVFDKDDDYVSFTDYVYDKFGGQGLEFTNVPIIASVRVTSELLKQTQDRFAMRLLSNEDVIRAQVEIQVS